MGMQCFGIGLYRLNEGATESSHAEAGAESSHAGSHPSVHAQQTAASPEPVTVPSGQAAKADTPPAAASSSVAGEFFPAEHDASRQIELMRE